jgi:class III poly(R)-hydroxyalkanoic acid synthase PhaE subunit
MRDHASNPAWMKDWQALQKQFLNAWTNAAEQAGVTPQVPIHQGFDVWAKLFGGQETGNEMLDRVMASSRQFMEFMQGTVSQLGGKTPQAGWAQALGDAFGGFSATRNPVLDAMRQAVGEGSQGFEQMFAEFARYAAPARQEWQAMFNLPAFGYTREAQERQQRMAQAMFDFQEQLGRYNALMLKASQRGIAIMESKLGERSEPGRAVKSFRELYDLWIDAAEEGYAEIALSMEFREIYGALVNAQMRVRQQVQGEVERAGAALGMPTRTELGSVHQKLADLRRRIARIEEALGLDELADIEPSARAPRPARDGGGGDSRGGPGNEQGNANASRSGDDSRSGPGSEQGSVVLKRPLKKLKPKKKIGPPTPIATAKSKSFADRIAAARTRGSNKGGK